MIATKTINPLPFLSLEPKRFEDLIRGLVYDLKIWRQLEATGRSGDDSGFDIRGWEIISVDEKDIDQEEDNNSDEEIPPYTTDRLWLIQGKREKSITPKKMESYLDEIFKENKDQLYGVIFATACDFSKKTRDLFRTRMIQEKIQEFALWSSAELEDMLYQPKNDNLLFAFFGISLQIRKRTITSKIKSRISIKAKTIKVLSPLEHHNYKELLIRDPESERYPFKKEIKNFEKNPHWIPAIFEKHYYSGIVVKYKEYHAYIDRDKKHWDYTREVNEVHLNQDPWMSWEERTEKGTAMFEFLKDVPEENKAMLSVYGYIPYEKIIAIDPEGDVICPIPQIFVPFEFRGLPFVGGVYGELYIYTGKSYNPREVLITNPSQKDRVKFFPNRFPKPKDNPNKDLIAEITVSDPAVTQEDKPLPDLGGLEKDK